MTKPPTDPITVKQAAALVGLTPARLYQLIDEGKLPAWKNAKGTHISRRLLLRWQIAQRVLTPVAPKVTP